MAEKDRKLVIDNDWDDAWDSQTDHTYDILTPAEDFDDSEFDYEGEDETEATLVIERYHITRVRGPRRLMPQYLAQETSFYRGNYQQQSSPTELSSFRDNNGLREFMRRYQPFDKSNESQKTPPSIEESSEENIQQSPQMVVTERSSCLPILIERPRNPSRRNTPNEVNYRNTEQGGVAIDETFDLPIKSDSIMDCLERSPPVTPTYQNLPSDYPKNVLQELNMGGSDQSLSDHRNIPISPKDLPTDNTQSRTSPKNSDKYETPEPITTVGTKESESTDASTEPRLCITPNMGLYECLHEIDFISKASNSAPYKVRRGGHQSIEENCGSSVLNENNCTAFNRTMSIQTQKQSLEHSDKAISGVSCPPTIGQNSPFTTDEIMTSTDKSRQSSVSDDKSGDLHDCSLSRTRLSEKHIKNKPEDMESFNMDFETFPDFELNAKLTETPEQDLQKAKAYRDTREELTGTRRDTSSPLNVDYKRPNVESRSSSNISLQACVTLSISKSADGIYESDDAVKPCNNHTPEKSDNFLFASEDKWPAHVASALCGKNETEEKHIYGNVMVTQYVKCNPILDDEHATIHHSCSADVPMNIAGRIKASSHGPGEELSTQRRGLINVLDMHVHATEDCNSCQQTCTHVSQLTADDSNQVNYGVERKDEGTQTSAASLEDCHKQTSFYSPELNPKNINFKHPEIGYTLEQKTFDATCSTPLETDRCLSAWQTYLRRQSSSTSENYIDFETDDKSPIRHKDVVCGQDENISTMCTSPLCLPNENVNIICTSPLCLPDENVNIMCTSPVCVQDDNVSTVCPSHVKTITRNKTSVFISNEPSSRNIHADQLLHRGPYSPLASDQLEIQHLSELDSQCYLQNNIAAMPLPDSLVDDCLEDDMSSVNASQTYPSEDDFESESDSNNYFGISESDQDSPESNCSQTAVCSSPSSNREEELESAFNRAEKLHGGSKDSECTQFSADGSENLSPCRKESGSNCDISSTIDSASLRTSSDTRQGSKCHFLPPINPNDPYVMKLTSERKPQMKPENPKETLVLPKIKSAPNVTKKSKNADRHESTARWLSGSLEVRLHCEKEKNAKIKGKKTDGGGNVLDNEDSKVETEGCTLSDKTVKKPTAAEIRNRRKSKCTQKARKKKLKRPEAPPVDRNVIDNRAAWPPFSTQILPERRLRAVNTDTLMEREDYIERLFN